MKQDETDAALNEFVETEGIEKLCSTKMPKPLYKHAQRHGGLAEFAIRSGKWDEWAIFHDPKTRCLMECKDYINTYGVLAFQHSEIVSDHYALYSKMRKYKLLPVTVLQMLNLTEQFNQAQRAFDIQKLVDEFKELYEANGVDALFCTWLSQNRYQGLYSRCSQLGLTLDNMAEELNCLEERLQRKHERSDNAVRVAAVARGQEVWTPERLDREVQTIIHEYGCIPSLSFLITKGHGGFGNGLKAANTSLNELREKYNVARAELRAINGLHFLSTGEVAICNYLTARGILVQIGRPYPKEYGEMYNRHSGIHDFLFTATAGTFIDQEIDGELWGGSKHTDRQPEYDRKRADKENFHKGNPCFVGIEYEDCMDDSKLQKIFEPFIGTPPVVKSRQDFPELSATRWSIADGVLETARKIMDHLKTDTFPCTDWLRRKKAYEGRAIADWEAASYEHFIDNIYLAGGLNQLRIALGQRGAPTRDSILEEAKEFYKKVKKTPYAATSYYKRKKELTLDERDFANKARHLAQYAKKFFGGHRQLCEAAGMAVRVTKASTKQKPKPIKKAVQQLDMQNKLLNTFASISQAARKTDLKDSNISACCNDRQASAGGFIWKFV